MINFVDSEIIDILPENMRSAPECIALSYALKCANQTLVTKANQTSVFAVIDTLPEKMVDILAIELRTQYYDESLPIETKKSLVKNTMMWYQKAGTVSAVQEMIDKVFDSGIVLEWFETDGEPGTFTISTSDTITPGLITEFKELIAKVKNVRSHLVDIVVGNKVDVNCYMAAGLVSHTVITLK